MRAWLSFLAVIVLVSGCDLANTSFPVDAEGSEKPVEELATNVKVVRLTAENINQFNRKRNLAGSRTTVASGEMWNYRIGVGDVLDVVVWDHPDLTMPAGDRRTPLESGLRVQSDGTFFYPHVGQVTARGRTPEQVRADLSARMAEFIPNPQMEVKVVGYNSQAVSVTGEVAQPSRQKLTDVPLTLLDAIDAAGGLTKDADPRLVTVRRGNKTHRVDLEAFLKNGVAANNPLLRGGDVVSVPRIELKEAFLLGQLVKPATIDLTRENINLTQAVTSIGGIKEGQADARGIFIFRDQKDGMYVYQLDASNPAAYLLGTRFVLHPNDVVYVTSSPIYRWNRLVSSLVPTLTTVRTADLIGSE